MVNHHPSCRHGYMMGIWWVYDGYMMGIWWVCDGYVMGIWWVYDGYMPYYSSFTHPSGWSKAGHNQKSEANIIYNILIFCHKMLWKRFGECLILMQHTMPMEVQIIAPQTEEILSFLYFQFRVGQWGCLNETKSIVFLGWWYFFPSQLNTIFSSWRKLLKFLDCRFM